MPDYAQLAEDRDERETAHYHAASDYNAGRIAFLAGLPVTSVQFGDQTRGWIAARNEARDGAITATRPQVRELDGDILFA